jgi:hypothetical protein
LKVKIMAAECEETPQEDPTGPEEMANIPSNWRAPRAGWLKANWDAALNNTSRKMGIGVVVRNESGEVVAALAKVIPFVEDPTAAEAIAAWHAVNLCVDRGFHQVASVGEGLTNCSFCAQPNLAKLELLWTVVRRHKSEVLEHASGGNQIC